VRTRIPLVASLNIEGFSGGQITETSSFLRNGVVEKLAPEPEPKFIVTQRPGIKIFEENDTAIFRGRGVYFWEDTDALYIVNGTNVYKNTYDTQVDMDSGTGGTQGIDDGTNRVYMTSVSDDLVIVDPNSNEGWVISSGDVGDVISDGDSPFDGAEPVTM
jgi:hypothetical protein